MNEQQNKGPARKILVWVTLLLLAGSAYCSYRSKVIRDQPPLDVQIPVHLTDGSRADIPLSIPWTRACEAGIQYERSTSVDVAKDLHDLSGEAVLSSNGAVVAKATMPTQSISYAGTIIGTTLFRFRSEKQRSYLLSLKVNHVPVELQNLQATFKIEDDFFHYKDAIGLTILSEVLGVFAILIIIPLTYTWVRIRRRRTT